jgi:putative flippase GtrA
VTETTRPSAPINRYRRTLWQFARFGIVGGSGIVVNMIVAILMNKLNGGTKNAQVILFGVAGTPYNFRFTSLVWIVAFLIANIWNFQLNRSWTFKSSKHATWFSEFWPFLAVGSAAAAVGLFLKVAFTNPTSPIYLPEPYFHENAGLQSREYWSQLITIVLTMPINFVVNKLWTFRAVRGHRLEAKAEQVGADNGSGTED